MGGGKNGNTDEASTRYLTFSIVSRTRLRSSLVSSLSENFNCDIVQKIYLVEICGQSTEFFMAHWSNKPFKRLFYEIWSFDFLLAILFSLVLQL